MEDVTGENLENLYRAIYDENAPEMRSVFPLLVSYVLMMVAGEDIRENVTNLVDAFGQGIQKDLLSVKHPIDETIAYVGSSQCKNVKKLLGVSYEQLQGEKEPDLNALKLVYKTKTQNRIFEISKAVDSLRQARSVEGDHRLVIFVHGFTDDPSKDSFTNISQSFLTNGHVAVMALDGSPLIHWLYLRSTTYVRFMGQKLAEILADLVYHGQDPSLIHIIGHSLGAHISGFAGKSFFDLTGKKVGRISGLDPAGPCFSHVDEELRLKATDGAFVDVIHTDAGVYGMKDPVGHVDYFPNSGAMQPNCLLQTCSHSRAWLYYGESVVNQEAFPALRCKDWEAFKKGQCEVEISYMGYPSKPGTKGLYFLQTKGNYPFGLGQTGTKYKETDGIVKNIENLFG